MTASKPRKGPSLRTWATPLTIGSFILMTVTGILMFFDVVPGYITFAHEWFSWIFVIGSSAHIAVNLRPFKNHLKSHWGRACVAVFSVIVVLSVFSWGRITMPQLKWPIAEALVNAPISALAQVKRTEPDALLRKLEKHGFKGNPEQSLMDLAKEHETDASHLIGIIFLPEEN